MKKYIALIMSMLLVLVVLSSCSTVGGDSGSSSTKGSPSVPVEPSGTDPDESGNDDPSDNGQGTLPPPALDDETDDGETTAEPEEEKILFTVNSGNVTIAPRTAYYWEGDYGTSLGGEAYLPILSEQLDEIAYSDEIRLLPAEEGTILHVKAYDEDFSLIEGVTGTDLSAFSTLAAGVYYVLVGVEWSGSPAYGYEFAFAVTVGASLYLENGDTRVFPVEIPVLREEYDDESGTFVRTYFDEVSLADAVKNAVAIDATDQLSFSAANPYGEFSQVLYKEDLTPASNVVTDLSTLYTELPAGTWYLVLRISWTGDYIETEDLYETVLSDYVVKLTVVG